MDTLRVIRLEVNRANLRKGISAQHFRNTYILRRIQENNMPGQIMQQIGFKSNLSLKRYYDYYELYVEHRFKTIT